MAVNLLTDKAALTPALLDWYSAHRRTFPWRQQPTPYRIWISEIMLQQTRIEAALPYFDRFVSELPTIAALAEVDGQRLLKLWEGLGYYSRARNLQKAARLVMSDYDGELPASYEQLLGLPGIGEYTAGAIASMAYKLPVPAVDGNALRVIARLLNDEGDVMSPPVRRELRKVLCAMMPADRPGDFNQAIMELGETICLPNTTPLCDRCPLAAGCRGFASGHPERLPVRAPKKARRIEQRTVLVILSENRVLLHRRPDKGLLAGLWELPNIDGHLSVEQTKAGLSDIGIRVSPLHTRPLEDGRHIFSHVEWLMKGIRLDMPFFDPPQDCAWADASRLREDYALPSAFRTYALHLPEWLSETTKATI